MEVAVDEDSHPIKQDLKKGELRFLKHGKKLYNYGFFPQTWEDPKFVHPDTKHPGDNDPIDVIEIGSKVTERGTIRPVKVLGCLALIDEGETDWKVIAIDVEDVLAPILHTVADVERELPGTISKIREWYRVYKVAEGKQANEYALGGLAASREYATEVILETHQHWKALQIKS
eukprot:TRINITY_DN798_c0_g1_i1.p1 TRINITY_DN798_c0_g1~~TRINITY_DN798_c0_g1_i1.p1  ORF type:complete len:199 (-),score=58.96 TRINITY_DN798_c0_g1_i1:40-561(-)